MISNDNGIIVYESHGNIYINLAQQCTAECVFCTKKYYSNLIKNPKIESDPINNSFVFNPQKIEDIRNGLEGLDLIKYNESLFSGDGQRIKCLDEVIYGYIKYRNKTIYGYDLNLVKEPSVEEVISELEKYDLSQYKEAVYTGMGEPLMRLDNVLEVTKWLTYRGVSVRLDTIGHAHFLYPNRNVAKELADSGMKSISLSLNADNEEIYNHICKPVFKNAYQTMLEFAKEIKKTGVELRFTIMDLPIVNKEKCLQIAQLYSAELFIRSFT